MADQNTPSIVGKFQRLADVLQTLGWLTATDVSSDATELAPRSRISEDGCLLRSVLKSDGIGYDLTDAFHERVERLVERGCSLRAAWPRGWGTTIAAWLGERFYFSHSRNFCGAASLSTIVGSQLGRQGQKLPQWPRLLNSTLRNIQERGASLLLAPKTTFFQPASEYAQTAGMNTLLLDPARDAEDLGAWLVRCLGDSDSSPEHYRNRLYLSPPMCRAGNAKVPLQDRAAIVIADAVYALSIRPGGNIDKLVRKRLQDDHFESGSVFVQLESPGQTTTQTATQTRTDWLDLGAVGWYVPSTGTAEATDLSQCRAFRATVARDCPSEKQSVGTQQICARFPGSWTTGKEEDWHYLSHCTRANCGPLPDETDSRYRHRLWIDGHVGDYHPMTMLNRICCERTLKGSSRITRTDQRCVSFSAVPLPTLLNQREFHSHLGRWDWEPYGLIVRRDALEAAGARPVVYGCERDFAELDQATRPFFQPVGKKSNDWTREREWRILGDLDLSALPPDAIRIFVRTRVQALQLSHRFPWPVFWYLRAD